MLNSSRRIISIGYPDFDPALCPETHREILDTLQSQLEFENWLAQSIAQGVIQVTGEGAALLKHGTFNLDSAHLLPYVIPEIVNLARTVEEPIRVGDIGGGNGGLLAAVKMAVPEGIHTTLTSLYTHDRSLIAQRLHEGVIDEYREMAIELPDTDLYQSFDMLIAQRSVYLWSQFPELATEHLLKMLKPGGMAIVTATSVMYEVSQRELFSAPGYLEQQIDWHTEHLGSDRPEETEIYRLSP